MTECQKMRAERAIQNLRLGGKSYQMSPPLPAVFCDNAKTTFKYGDTITDNIASWIKKGFVSGPFDQAPEKLFRVNSILATKQKEKVRTVLNVSLPKGSSFNDNIDELKLEKVKMCTAKKFSYTIAEAGKNALMCKFDMQDAYKNVPVPLEELRLQGFQWLGKFFIETRQIFGSKSAVSNFDILGQTIQDIAIIKSNTPRKWVHRTLDDVPVTGPDNSNFCEKFEETYRGICSKCNIKLAENCDKFDKAFGCSKYGKVLGIWFETKHMRWSLPKEKIEKTKAKIAEVYWKNSTSLLEMQQLMGSLNDITQMCDFLRGFKKPLNNVLSYLQRNENKTAKLNSQAKKDLVVFWNFLSDTDNWHPIARRPCSPPIHKISLTSDAAGCSRDTKKDEQVGFASIGIDAKGLIFFASQTFWETSVLQEGKDNKGKNLGSKTTTLEFLGILIPFLLIPEKLCNTHITVEVDNISCVYAWQNKHSREDEMASILVRALHLITFYLGSTVYAIHLPRMSTWEASMVDRMSRKSTTTRRDKNLLDSFSNRKIPKILSDWMKNPKEDWEMATALLEHVEKIIRL